MAEPFIIAKGAEGDVLFYPRMSNRHGLITGATGTGKTVTLQALAEHFSDLGVPVFMADVKGDLSGLARAGGANPKVADRITQLGIKDFAYNGYPVAFWDVFGEQGHPLRSTISEMGPLLLGRMFNLNDIQAGVLNIIFKYADDNGLLILDTKDLRAMSTFVADNASSITTEYGKVSSASIGAIQRALLQVEQQGGDKFFGEPALDLEDLMQTDSRGKGMINILAADKLFNSPLLYSTFLLWLVSELFETLPEVGDADKPKMVFFFDEAHLLFDEAPKVLLDKVEQVVRLIRSRGVGIYFVTQNPIDVPDTVLGQLGNRVQHALRAYTPRDQKGVQAAAETFRQNPKFDTAIAITELGVGEALVSTLDEKGVPTVVQRCFVIPPHSQIGPITPDQRDQVIHQSLVYGHYEKLIDRESAYEVLKGRAAASANAAAAQKQGQMTQQQRQSAFEQKQQQGQMVTPAQPKAQPQAQQKPSELEKALGTMANSAMRGIGSTLGREITRGIMGSLFGGGTTSTRRKRY
ncbi:MAG TPA: DUF853 domain-containing protein [Thermoflexales bacterium]|nr:DUF853 domain-containing protein [Thermoflexales bacterium]HQW34297.1 DUF853 domain-containing protein [Thermoflexales bacterium]HQZ21789.1 DUF853 domain-containing protein [Thermoflexales bacterium]HQZ99208.1 DUF853 domain-containing protein [Thermoflexales bacterium]